MSGDERALNRLVSEWVLVVRNSKTNIWGGTKGKYSRREILKVRAIYHIEKWKLDPCELWQQLWMEGGDGGTRIIDMASPGDMTRPSSRCYTILHLPPCLTPYFTLAIDSIPWLYFKRHSTKNWRQTRRGIALILPLSTKQCGIHNNCNSIAVHKSLTEPGGRTNTYVRCMSRYIEYAAGWPQVIKLHCSLHFSQ